MSCLEANPTGLLGSNKVESQRWFGIWLALWFCLFAVSYIHSSIYVTKPAIMLYYYIIVFWLRINQSVVIPQLYPCLRCTVNDNWFPEIPKGFWRWTIEEGTICHSSVILFTFSLIINVHCFYFIYPRLTKCIEMILSKYWHIYVN